MFNKYIFKDCERCRNRFYVRNAQKDQVYCGKKCLEKSESLPKTNKKCLVCNSKFKASYSKTCSETCDRVFFGQLPTPERLIKLALLQVPTSIIARRFNVKKVDIESLVDYYTAAGLKIPIQARLNLVQY